MPPPGKRGKYLGFVAHEIKNPLATALWSCDLLKRMDAADRGGERAEKMIDVSLRALRRMRRLIEDFFTIERLLEHGYDLKQEKIALKDLVEPALHTLAEKDGISTDGWVLELGNACTTGDSDMLRRAVRASLEHMARGSLGPRLSVAARAGPSRSFRRSPETGPAGIPPGPSSALRWLPASSASTAVGSRNARVASGSSFRQRPDDF